MVVQLENGYSLPGGDLPLTHARILHKGNEIQVANIEADIEQPEYPAAATQFGDTVDSWRPFSNLIPLPDQEDFSDWIQDEVTLFPDNQTIRETTATDNHRLQYTYSFPVATDFVIAFTIERQSAPEIRITANDSVTNFGAYFDLRDLTVGSTIGGATGAIRENPDGTITARIVAPIGSTGTGSVQLRLANGSESDNYTGNADTGLKVRRAIVHRSQAELTVEGLGDAEVDTMCIAAHNLDTLGLLTFQEDSDFNFTWADIGNADIVPPNNSPFMYIFEPITGQRWRLRIKGAVEPEISVFKVGKLLQMERPFYAGARPARMSRRTEVRGNLSGTGELRGRSVRRTVLETTYSWRNLTYPWVRANLDGRAGLIQSLESEPAFIAWRQASADDCDYIMQAQVQPPVATGITNRYEFSMSAEVYGYE